MKLFFIILTFFLSSCSHKAKPHYLDICTYVSELNHETSFAQVLYVAKAENIFSAISIYQQIVQQTGYHDFSTLKELSLIILEQTLNSRKPEELLLAVYSSAYSQNIYTLPIIKKALASNDIQLQLASINALTSFQDDRADNLLMQTLSSPSLLIRLETAYRLALKKDPNSVAHLEALAQKSPPEIKYLFSHLFCIMETPNLTSSIKKLLMDPSDIVRSSMVLNLAKAGRDDFLPLIQTLQCHHNLYENEACAFAYGIFKTLSSIDKLNEWKNSSSDYVIMQSLNTLFLLGDISAKKGLETYAKNENLYAIYLLSTFNESEKILSTLLKSDNKDTVLNATLSLLEQKNRLVIPKLREIFCSLKNHKILITSLSPAKTLLCYRYLPLVKKTLKTNPYIKEIGIRILEDVLNKCYKLPQADFLFIANQIMEDQINELIPTLINLLESLRTKDAIDLLKKGQQKPGYPLLRAYCNLALYRLKVDGPWESNLYSWIEKESSHKILKIRLLIPFEVSPNSIHYDLTAEETSRLLIESYQSVAASQSKEAIELLLNTLKTAPKDHQILIAGLIIKAVE